MTGAHGAPAAHAELERAERYVDPRSGELLDLATAPPEQLADALDVIRQLRNFEKAIEGELRARLAVRQRTEERFGEWTVRVEQTNRSVWDAEELEGVLRELVGEGAITRGEATGVIRREVKVSGTEANSLAKRLTGDARQAVEACRTWERKSGPLRLERIGPQLEEAS
jgi:hypothetical protein